MGLEIQVQDAAVRTAIDQTALCKSPSPPGLPGVRTAIEQTALQITITTTTSNEFCKPPSPPALPFL